MKINRSFILILLLTFFSGTLLTLLSPIAIDIEKAIPQITQTDVHFVVSVFLMVGALSSLFWAILVERFAPKVLLIISTLDWATFEFLTIFTTNVFSLLFFQIFAAIGFGAILPITFSLIANLFEPENRAKAFGLKETIFIIGYGSGFILSGFLIGPFSWIMPLLIISIGGFSLSFLLLFFKEPVNTNINTQTITSKRWINLKDLHQIVINKFNLMILSFYFVMWIAFGAIAQFFTNLLRNDYNFSPPMATIFLIVVFCGQIPSGIVFGNLADKWLKRKKGGRLKVLLLCLICGSILNTIGFALVISTDNFSTIILFLTLTFLGSTFLGALDPLTQTTISDINPSHLRSTLFAIFECFKSLGRSLSILLLITFFNAFHSQYRPGYIILMVLTLLFSIFLVPLLNYYPENVLISADNTIKSQ